MVEETTSLAVDRAADAFGTLADENRIAILLALWHEQPLSFAALQEAADFDDSGRFNYHLDKLVGRFVGKDDDRYRLRPAGARALDILYDERFGEQPSPVERDLETPCPSCGTPLQAVYEDGRIEISCPACSVVVHYGYFPPRGRAARDPEALFLAYSRQLWRDFTLASAGVCPHCSGRMETHLEVDPDWHLDVATVSVCQHCNVEIGTPVGLRLLDDPAVVAFLSDHGIDVDDVPFWTLAFCLGDDRVSIDATEPIRATVHVEQGEDRLEVIVDESGTVIETALVSSRR
jgi:ribosomal protein S27E